MNSLLRLSITEFWFDPRKKESEMTVRCSGRCYYIVMLPDKFRDSPAILKQYLRDAELNADKREHYTLYDYLNSETFHYSLLAINDTLISCPEEPVLSQQRPHGADLQGYELGAVCHSYQPMQVQICSDHPNSEGVLIELPEKVLVDWRICFFKPFGGGERRSALRELECYKRIGDLQCSVMVQVPALCGAVQDNSRCLGLLLSWVDCRRITLECALRPSTPRAQRQRWANQLTTTLHHLHNAGIIWGDAKPANVLVDSNDDLWIIDFGGGYTRGWVEKDKAGTIEGDNDGLMKIKDCLLR
ncbi:protein kinase subdomain-containing protein [Nannizzia gypsea CBS 118893]|uniref:Protein kinase subdomain-containing protein n=1 Tax=Arthroderma gypseum (strain ATCC MYA-4604 / CBS 118893) TaxID=535722 RepID=E5R274_ARTGP|nr:protein kinase subdomain-containing protein [Nannizzia gypsea CBS 118893]EFQ98638.1 protein kinase subdomain-containing protein [Nannizzia gypsea CBS 118893]